MFQRCYIIRYQGDRLQFLFQFSLSIAGRAICSLLCQNLQFDTKRFASLLQDLN